MNDIYNTTFTVPYGYYTLYITGTGAGGGYNIASHKGGSGANCTKYALSVTPGQTIKLFAGDGGAIGNNANENGNPSYVYVDGVIVLKLSGGSYGTNTTNGAGGASTGTGIVAGIAGSTTNFTYTIDGTTYKGGSSASPGFIIAEWY